MKVVGVTFGVNSIVCKADSTGGVHLRSNCDCLKAGEEKNADHLSETQSNRCDASTGRREKNEPSSCRRFDLFLRSAGMLDLQLGGLCFGTMELWLDELDGTNEQQGGCDG